MRKLTGLTEKEISLGTTDRTKAELAALPHIREHKLMQLMIRHIRAGTVRVTPTREYEPGQKHYGPDGEEIIATEDTIIVMRDGKIVETRPNKPKEAWTIPKDPATAELLKYEPKPKRVSLDDAVLQAWTDQRRPDRHIEREARKAWALLRGTTRKPLNQLTRGDGRAFMKALQERGLKAATANKYLSHLSSAVAIAIDDGKLTFNPFSRVRLEVTDRLQREPFRDEHMALVRQHLESFAPDEARLWVLLSTTGMRRGEAWDIQGEEDELGIRTIRIGTKTPQSDRRIPLPSAYLQRYSEPIAGPLFQDSPVNVGKRLLRRIRDLGITDERLVLHSLRHRALTRLRAVGCPQDIREWICGHEQITAALGYGKGPPMRVLRPWVDQIGY